MILVSVRPLRSVGGALPGQAVRSVPDSVRGFEAAGGVGQRSVGGRLLKGRAACGRLRLSGLVLEHLRRSVRCGKGSPCSMSRGFFVCGA